MAVLQAGPASAIIEPERGGMLVSVDIGGLELLQPRRDHTGPIPKYGSFLLARWVGEMFEGRLPFGSEVHQLPLNVGRHAAHGLVFTGKWDIESETRSELQLRRELGQPWPLGGFVGQRFELTPNSLMQIAEVEAGDR